MTDSLMDTLKEATRSLHNDTEGNGFQKSLFSGALPKKRFVDYLGQMYLIHKTLEDGLSELRNQNSIVANIIEDHQYQQDYLRNDLGAADIGTHDLKALPATQELIDHLNKLKSEKPMSLVGCEYVLFGSKHGAKLLSKQLEKYQLWKPGLPNYFDPYGDRFSGYWQSFKTKMNAARFSPNEQEQIIAGAKDMFSSLSKVFDDLLSLA